MDIQNFKINDLIPYENNPRINDNAVDAVANSIKEFGFKVPIIVDKDDVIVAGHTRLKAAQKLGFEEVPVIVADDLTDDQVKAFRIADNKVGELAEWDFDKLEAELGAIEMYMNQFGFDDELITGEGGADDTYTTKIEIPQYEMTKDEAPNIETLCDTDKSAALIDEINKSNVSRKEKAFLKLAAARHNVFDYSEIAEYYAHATPEMQELMEKSALVIIDYDDAIANGYVKIKSDFDEVREMDEVKVDA